MAADPYGPEEQADPPATPPAPRPPAELTTATAAAQPPTPVGSWGQRETLGAAPTDQTARLGSQPIEFGSYEILDEIARGGMGIVFLARHRTLQRLVALKIMRPGGGENSDRARRFDREARAAAQLDHRHIVPILDHGVCAAQHYYTMALMVGGTLDRERQRIAADPRAAATVMEKIAQAVAHAHARGIVHRDLKPSNILIDEHGEPLVSDFGLAKLADGETELTVCGAMLGTPAYMAPEQASGQSGLVGRQSDVWSLGVILYELLAGRRPFEGNSSEEIRLRIRQTEPVRPERLRAGLDRQLQTIVLKCLEKEPARRYSSAAELADDLGRWLRGQPIAARPLNRLERAWLWCRRRPQLAGLCALILASLVIGAGGSYVALGRHKTSAAIVVQSQPSPAAEEQRRLLYGAAMGRVAAFWDKANIAGARRELEALTPPPGAADPRGFEWHYFQQLCDHNLGTLADAPGGVGDFAYSPDGSLLASGGNDGMIRIWELASSKVVRSWRAHQKRIDAVAFHPDGKQLASAGEDGTVKIWRIEGARMLHELRPPGEMAGSLAFDASGRRLAGACGVYKNSSLWGQVVVWETATGKTLLTLPRQLTPVECVAWRADGRRLAAANGDGTVAHFDDAGTRIATLRGHHSPVKAVALSHDGRLLASGGGDRTIQLWELGTPGAPRVLRNHREPVSSLAFSPDDSLLASGSLDQTVRIWDTKTADNTLTLRGHTGAISRVEFSPDGFPLASASADGTIKFWDPAARQDFELLHEPSSSVLSLAFAPDGLLVYGCGRRLVFWDPRLGRVMRAIGPLSASINAVACSPDGRTVATGDAVGQVAVWNAATGAPVWSFAGHNLVVMGLVFSPDGTLIASGSFDGTVKLWNAASGLLVATLGERRRGIWGLAFSHDGSRLAEANHDKTATVWDVASGQPVFVLRDHTEPVHAVAFSRDDKLLATGSMDQTVKTWNTVSGELLQTFTGDRSGVRMLAFSPDGQRLACGGWSGSVSVWDPIVRQELLSFSAHSGPVFGMAFSADGTRLASGASDCTVAIWDAKLPDEARRQQWFARGLVQNLLSRPLSRAEVMRLLTQRPGLNAEVRRQALELCAGPPLEP